MRILGKLKTRIAPHGFLHELEIVEEVMREEESRAQPFFGFNRVPYFLLLFYILLGALIWRFFGH